MSKLKLHCDDSSDEEVVESGLEEDLPGNSARFLQAAGNDTVLGTSKDALEYSFINYSYGLMLFHAASVTQEYRKRKHQYIEHSNVPSDEVISEWVKNAMRESIRDALLVRQHRAASNKLSKLCIEYLEEEIEDIVKACLKHKRQLIRAITHRQPLPKEINDKIVTFNQEIDDFVKIGESYEVITNADFSPPERVTGENFYREAAIRQWAERKYAAELAEIDGIHGRVVLGTALGIPQLVTPQKTSFSSSTPTKKKCRQVLARRDLTKLQRKYVTKIDRLQYASNKDKFLRDFKAQFLTKQLQLLIDKEKAKGDASILLEGHIEHFPDIANSEFAELEGHLDVFEPYNIADFRLEQEGRCGDRSIDERFVTNLEASRQQVTEPNFRRSSLPLMFTHSFASSVEYIASLRLTNRSVLRTVRNQANETSIFGDSKETNADFGWQFPAMTSAIAIERTRITRKARSAVVPIQTGSHSYSALSDKIDVIKSLGFITSDGEHEKLSDKDIAKWIRQIMQCKDIDFRLHDRPDIAINYSAKPRKDICEFLVQLAHLIGGTEVARYPGAAIENQMVIDLILAGKLTWKQAFTPSGQVYMPMVVDGAVPVARVLTTTFSQYNNYRYSYPGDNDNKGIRGENTQSFIQAEKRLSQSWVAMVREREGNTEKSFVDAVKESVSGWYLGIS